MVSCDVVVVGAGAMGSSTAWWLSRWGLDVVLLEQFHAGHDRGSSHGSTRVFRLAYPEPEYVHMARRAMTLWREVEDDTGQELLLTTGGIDYGNAESAQAITESLVLAGVEHEVFGPGEAAERWPGFVFDGPVIHQPDAGRLAADAAVRALQVRAADHGASVRFDEPVRSVTPKPSDTVSVTTDTAEYRAAAVVVTAGAWVDSLLDGLVDLPQLTVTREQVFHFPSRSDETPWPVFIHHGGTFIYGLQAPDDEGVKVAEHHTGPVTTAADRSFEIDEIGRQRVVRHVARWMPGLASTPTSSTTCLYTNTPDESFVLERRGPIVIGSACSGHGFKFVPLVGQRLAELATGRA